MFRISHLSDLHAREETRWSTDALLIAAKKILLEEANRQNFDVLAFTGDIAFSGKSQEYQIASEWIEDFCLSPSGLNLENNRLLFVPGNHDVDRSRISPVADAIHDCLSKSSSQEEIAKYFNDKQSLDTLLEPHGAYREFCTRVRGSANSLLPSWTQSFEFLGRKIVFEGFCSSWLCRGDDDNGRLVVGQPQLTQVIRNRPDHDLLIAMMHHPLAWLMEFDQQNVETHLRGAHDVLLRGHMHRQDVVRKQSQTGTYVEIAAGALHERHDTLNRFSVIDISDDLGQISVKAFTWRDNQWVLDRKNTKN